MRRSIANAGAIAAALAIAVGATTAAAGFRHASKAPTSLAIDPALAASYSVLGQSTTRLNASAKALEAFTALGADTSAARVIARSGWTVYVMPLRRGGLCAAATVGDGNLRGTCVTTATLIGGGLDMLLDEGADQTYIGMRPDSTASITLADGAQASVIDNVVIARAAPRELAVGQSP